MAQTSPKIFAFLLTLYSLQLFNWAVYSYNVHTSHDGNDDDPLTCNAECDSDGSPEQFVSLTELLVPLALSLALSLIHSQIVATASNNALPTSKQRNYGSDQLHAGGRKRRERRKRKKCIRIRSTLNCPAADQPTLVTSQKSCLAGRNRRFAGDCLTTDNSFTSNATDGSSTLKDDDDVTKLRADDGVMARATEALPQLRKRNVYWDSPIKSQVNISAKVADDSNDDSENAQPIIIENDRRTDHTTGDDDGFESLNGKSSSGEEMAAGVVEMSAMNDDDDANLSTNTGECEPEAISGNAKVSFTGGVRCLWYT